MSDLVRTQIVGFLMHMLKSQVIFCQNLSPVLTRMTKEVDAREKELTHQVHRDMLIRSLEQVKNLTPVLISGIKIFITAKQTSKWRMSLAFFRHPKYLKRSKVA